MTTLRPMLLALSLLLLTSPALAEMRIEVDLSERILRTYVDGQLGEEYLVAVGTKQDPTPRGTFQIKKMIWNPSWKPPNEKWARGKKPQPPGAPDNPMKRVKMFFKQPDYYIHGTDDLDSLGNSGSHGCLRMAPDDVTRLAQQVMTHGGKPQPESWFRRIFRRKTTKVVYLTHPVPIDIKP